MHVTPNGASAPRDWCQGKRNVALAAVAVLFLFATPARANMIRLIIDMEDSWLTQTTKLVGPALGGSKTSVPQQAVAGPYGEASNKTHFFGDMYFDFQPLSIQLMPSSSLGAIYTGAYAPHDYVFQDPPGAPYPVGVTPGSYGLAIPAFGLSRVQYNVRLDVGDIADGFPSTPMPLTGENFNLFGQALSFSDGRQATISALGNKTESLVGKPLVFFGTAGSDIGTWSDFTQTMTLPVHSSWSFHVTNDFGGIEEFVNVTGQIVLHPQAPEPATVTLLGLGVAGLLGFAWRARKERRARCVNRVHCDSPC